MYPWAVQRELKPSDHSDDVARKRSLPRSIRSGKSNHSKFGRGIPRHWNGRHGGVRPEQAHRHVEIGMLIALVVAQTLQSRSAWDAMEDGPLLQRT